MATDRNLALARRWFEEVWNQRRTATVHELLEPDSVCHTDRGDMVGPQPFLDFHAQMVQAMPDLRITVEDAIAEGDRVAVRWSVNGTHSGPFQGKSGTGKAIHFRGVTWIHYRDGKLVEGFDCFNLDGLMGQLSGGG
jgi:steroid delta-isomerase-like uncharacterized protein